MAANRPGVQTLVSRAHSADRDRWEDHQGPYERTDDQRERDQRIAAQPSVIAAHALLRLALGTRLEDFDRSPQCLLIELPDPAWEWTVMEAFRLHVKGGRPAERTILVGIGPLDPHDWCVYSAMGKRARPTDDEAAAVLGAGGQLLILTDDAATMPTGLRAAADREAKVPPMSWAALRHVAEAVCGPDDGWPVEPRPETEALARVTPSVLALAMRREGRARDYAVRVLQIAAAKDEKAMSAPASRDRERGMEVLGPRGLARVPGMGAALEWAEALAADLASYKAGRLPWANVDKGALLVGPPGTGKTSFARALAEECGVPLILASHAAWQAQGHQGDMLKAMRASFAEARGSAPSILFIDEVDSFPDRQAVAHEHGGYTVQVVNGLLAEMDGALSRDGVVVIGACNNPGLVDPALKRAGRLDRIIEIGLPDFQGRVDILRVHLSRDLLNGDLGQAARLAEGMSGAELEKAVREARRAARAAGRGLLMGDLVVAVAEARDLDLTAAHSAFH